MGGMAEPALLTGPAGDALGGACGDAAAAIAGAGSVVAGIGYVGLADVVVGIYLVKRPVIET